MRREREEVAAVRVEGHGVADGGDLGPAWGGAREVVGCGVGVEGRVACGYKSRVSWPRCGLLRTLFNAGKIGLA